MITGKNGVGWVEESLSSKYKALLSTRYKKTTENTEMTKGRLAPKELLLREYRSRCLSRLTAAGGSPDEGNHPKI